jgi:hypothetical protein
MLEYIELNMNKYFIGKILIFNIFEFIFFCFFNNNITNQFSSISS